MSAFTIISLKNIVVFLVFLNKVSPIFGENNSWSTEEECSVSSQQKGVCTTFTRCPTESLNATGTPPVICRFQGDIAYICCPLSNNLSNTGGPDLYDYGPATPGEGFQNRKPKESPYNNDDATDKSYGNYDFNRFRDHINHWNGRRAEYYQTQQTDNGNYLNNNEKRFESNSFYGTKKKPQRWGTGESTDNFHFSNENGNKPHIYNNNQKQSSSGSNEWSVPWHEHKRPQSSSGINWQGNQQSPSTYDRRTTRRPPSVSNGSGNGNNYWYVNQRPASNYDKTTNRPTATNRPVQHPEYWPNSGTNFNRPDTSFGNRKKISEIKCEEYSEPVIDTISVLPLLPNPNPLEIKVQKCISAQQLIVGGENTTAGEFPHMAALGFQDGDRREIKWRCGGSLISDQYVLTAAHCTMSHSTRLVRVRLGDYNLQTSSDGVHHEDYSVADIIRHPDYRPPIKYNDIALIKLSRKVNIRKNIRPACLHTRNDLPEQKVIAVGWGQTQRDEKQSDVLLKVALSVVGKNTCNDAYDSRHQNLPLGIVDSQICAGDSKGGKDTCQGDSGGPIEYVNHSNQCIHYIVGLTSFGKVCGQPNSPGVYTRVSSYIPWIESIVWSNNYSF